MAAPTNIRDNHFSAPRRGRKLGAVCASVAVSALTSVLGAVGAVPAHAAALRAGCTGGEFSDLEQVGRVGFSGTNMEGYADDTTQSLGARSTAAFSERNANADCDTTVRFENGITVGPGSTGLAAGTPVQLTVTVRLDGALRTVPPAGSGGSSADGNAEYSITDDSVPDTGEGDSGTIVAFTAGWNQQHYPSGGRNLSQQSRWRLGTNASTPQEYFARDEGTSAEPVQMVADTGTLTATYATEVGAHLSLYGRLSTVASAYGTASEASANYLDGFQASSAPAAGFEGLDLVYDVGDTPPNQPPVCVDGSGTTSENTALTSSVSCTDPDGDAVEYAVTSGPSSGTLSPISAQGEFTYTPSSGFVGTDAFTYSASDGEGGTAAATYTVSVNRVVVGPPTSKDECANGGWLRFNNPSFKNQGACVAHVAKMG